MRPLLNTAAGSSGGLPITSMGAENDANSPAFGLVKGDHAAKLVDGGIERF